MEIYTAFLIKILQLSNYISVILDKNYFKVYFMLSILGSYWNVDFARRKDAGLNP